MQAEPALTKESLQARAGHEIAHMAEDAGVAPRAFELLRMNSEAPQKYAHKPLAAVGGPAGGSEADGRGRAAV